MRIRHIKALWKEGEVDYCKFCRHTDYEDGRCIAETCWVHIEKSVLGKVAYAGLAIVAAVLLLATAI